MERVKVETPAQTAPHESSAPILKDVISPAPREIWSEIYYQDPKALVTQKPDWVDAVCQVTGGRDASRLYMFNDGQRVLLPFVKHDLPLGISAVLSSYRNSWGIGGVIAKNPVRQEELELVLADLNRLSEIRYSIRPNPLDGRLWEAALVPGVEKRPRAAHVLNLEGGFGDVWERRFKSVARTAVRKAERSGLVVEKDTTGRLLPVFYQLFETSLARWGSQQNEPLFLSRFRGHQRDPIRKFEAISERLKQAFQIWIAWLDGQPAAGIIVLQETNAYYTRGAMDKSLAGPSRANDLLHRMAIEDACLAGCRFYHMGESGTSKSLSSFKSNFGAEAFEYPEIYHERLPLTRVETALRGMVKKLIGFKDA